MPVRIDDIVYEQACIEAKIARRSVAGQIAFWAMVGAVRDNPDLSVKFVSRL